MTRSSILLGAAAAALFAAPALAASLPVRTFSMSLGVNNVPANGDSARPALTGDGRRVAFDSAAVNLAADGNGSMRDVFLHDVLGNTTEIISRGLQGAPANGPSSHAAVGGRVVAFQSDASNLVEADANAATDVFARGAGGPIVRVSVALGGGDADGASHSADLSADGRYVVFVSEASNLIAEDTNGEADVFIRDLRSGTTRRVSERQRAGADGPSSAPSISPDGRYVSFASTAQNLVDRDTNGIQDVFLADTRRRRIKRVSVNDRGRQQNRSVIQPFSQVSDVSRGGWFVAFDSDATNLVAGDRNRDTDVFVHNARLGRTRRVSLDKFGFEGDNDSINPTISPDGRFIAFQSFARRLADGDGPKEDVFVYDRRTFAPVTLSVGARGAVRDRERRPQLLQRPRISDNGYLAAFSSTAGNLVSGDTNRAEDIFMRVTIPARVRVRDLGPVERSTRPRIRLRADDPRVREFLCELDRVRIPCGRSTRLPRIGPGRHVLTVRAGGPGILFQTRPLTRRFRVAP